MRPNCHSERSSCVYTVAAKLGRQNPRISPAKRESFARLEFRHDGIVGTRIPGVRANVKTHLVHPHERARARARARSLGQHAPRSHAYTYTHTLAFRIPTERPMTGMTCTRCRTEDPSRSSSAPSPLSRRPSPCHSPLASTVDPLDARRLGRARLGYLLSEGGAGLI